jgi:hypothetical protein
MIIPGRIRKSTLPDDVTLGDFTGKAVMIDKQEVGVVTEVQEDDEAYYYTMALVDKLVPLDVFDRAPDEPAAEFWIRHDIEKPSENVKVHRRRTQPDLEASMGKIPKSEFIRDGILYPTDAPCWCNEPGVEWCPRDGYGD